MLVVQVLCQLFRYCVSVSGSVLVVQVLILVVQVSCFGSAQ